MNKTFTLNIFNYFRKSALIALFICIAALLQPGIADTGTLKDVQAKTIKCYPNPAISFVNFEFLDEYVSKNYSIQVFSFSGKKMYESNITSSKLTITFSNEFYRGIYVYQLRDKDGKIVETGKFQVSK